MTEAHATEDVIVSKRRGKWVIKSALWPAKKGNNKKMKEKLEYLKEVYLKPVLFRVLGILCTLLSFTIILSESTLYIDFDMTPLSLSFKYDYGVVYNEILALIPLTYLVMATHQPLFEIRLEGIYGLYPNRNTQPSSLIYSACFLARLMPIIVYNFLMMIQIYDTDFMDTMNLMNFMPKICKQYFIYFPMILSLLCLMNFFNVYNKFVRMVGLQRYAFSEDLREEKKVQGRMLISKDRAERERSLRHSKVSESKIESLLLEYDQKYSACSSVNA